jgi:hypothetical protein
MPAVWQTWGGRMFYVLKQNDTVNKFRKTPLLSLVTPVLSMTFDSYSPRFSSKGKKDIIVDFSHRVFFSQYHYTKTES